MTNFREILQLTVLAESQAVPAVLPDHSDDGLEFGEDDEGGPGQGDKDIASDEPAPGTFTGASAEEDQVDDDEDNNGAAPRKWKEHQFWSYVDLELEEVRELTAVHVRDKKDREAKITECVSICHTCSHGLSTPIDSSLRVFKTTGRITQIVASLASLGVRVPVHHGRQ